MKKLVVVLCLGLVVGVAAEVEYGRLYRSGLSDEWSPSSQIMLNEDEVFSFLKMYYINGSYLNSDGTVVYSITFDTGHTYLTSTSHIRSVRGPCTLVINNNSGSGLRIEYSINRPDVAVQAGPMNIIALPADNNGDVDVLVETDVPPLNGTTRSGSNLRV
jgi:hypothetical protein